MHKIFPILLAASPLYAMTDGKSEPDDLSIVESEHPIKKPQLPSTLQAILPKFSPDGKTVMALLLRKNWSSIVYDIFYIEIATNKAQKIMSLHDAFWGSKGNQYGDKQRYCFKFLSDGSPLIRVCGSFYSCSAREELASYGEPALKLVYKDITKGNYLNNGNSHVEISNSLLCIIKDTGFELIKMMGQSWKLSKTIDTNGPILQAAHAKGSPVIATMEHNCRTDKICITMYNIDDEKAYKGSIDLDGCTEETFNYLKFSPNAQFLALLNSQNISIISCKDPKNPFLATRIETIKHPYNLRWGGEDLYLLAILNNGTGDTKSYKVPAKLLRQATQETADSKKLKII